MDYNIPLMTAEIKARDAKRVFVQLPEGLKRQATDIVAALENQGITAFTSSRPTYGACDIADREAKAAGCDLLVHVGHSKFYRDFDTAVPVLYFPWKIAISLEGIDFSAIKEKRIGLVTTIQHVHLLDDAKKRLEASGKEVVVGGQILGCWSMNAINIESDVDAFLFVGSGLFHPLGVKSDKKIYVLDLERRAVAEADTARFEKRRWANIFAARDAKTFGILVSTKGGQHNLLGDPVKIKETIEREGRKAYILITDEVRDDELLGMKVDAFINTACPRLLDNSWSKPIVNGNDVDRIFERI